MSVSSAWMNGYTAGFVDNDDSILLPHNLDGQIRNGRFVAMNIMGDNVTVLDDVVLRNRPAIDFDPAILDSSFLHSVDICTKNQLVSLVRVDHGLFLQVMGPWSRQSLHKTYDPDPGTLC